MRKKVNNFSGNVPTWLAIADLNIDYYTQFIKSWIPFNAWYTVSYFSETLDSDRKIIDKIKETSNPYRDRIINLLRGDDNTSSQFRYFVSQLHIELEGHSIPNHEQRISFSSINIKRNTKTQHTHSYRSFSYKVDFNPSAPKTTKRLKCEILNKKTFSNVYLDDFYDYSIDDLIKSEKYIALSPESREQLRLCYEEINPYKPENIVIKPNPTRKCFFWLDEPGGRSEPEKAVPRRYDTLSMSLDNPLLSALPGCTGVNITCVYHLFLRVFICINCFLMHQITMEF